MYFFFDQRRTRLLENFKNVFTIQSQHFQCLYSSVVSCGFFKDSMFLFMANDNKQRIE